jgi:CRISPR-associated protein Cas1
MSLKDKQLVFCPLGADGPLSSVPIEDIGYVVLENQMDRVTLPLLNALADNNTAVILCNDKSMPNAMLLNLDSNNTQAEGYRFQVEASAPLKKSIWKQTVESKIRNQSFLLKKLGYDGDCLKVYYMNVKSGDSDNREGIAAKSYWKLLFGKDFIRSRELSTPNNLLNYGYTILRAAVARALMGSGLFPAFGIFHRNRYNAFPLADDIMEPYRPFVDEIVYELFFSGDTELTQTVKAKLVSVLTADTMFSNTRRPLDVGLSMTTASLAKCFAGKQKQVSYPRLK